MSLRHVPEWYRVGYGDSAANTLQLIAADHCPDDLELSVEGLYEELRTTLRYAKIEGDYWPPSAPDAAAVHILLGFIMQVWPVVADRGWPHNFMEEHYIRDRWFRALLPQDASRLVDAVGHLKHDFLRPTPHLLAGAIARDAINVGDALLAAGTADGNTVRDAGQRVQERLVSVPALVDQWEPIAAAIKAEHLARKQRLGLR